MPAPTITAVPGGVSYHSNIEDQRPRALAGVESSVEDSLIDALPGLVYAKMGESSLSRLSTFRRWPDGWDNGRGRAIVLPTLLNLQYFLVLPDVQFRPGRPPSLFLTAEGAIEVVYRSSSGQKLQIIFDPFGAEYCFESTNEEGRVSPARIQDVGFAFARATSA